MPVTQGGRRGLIAALGLVAPLLVAMLWLPRWWQNRTDRRSETLAGIGAVLPGSVTDARRKIDAGRPEKAVVEAIGKPSVAVETRGAARHSIWTYYYADGTMTLNLTNGYLARADLEYGPPRRGTPNHP
ncbi:MAG: hypothetical protein ACRD00_02395 [Thermoanaerobaculia bacterium]